MVFKNLVRTVSILALSASLTTPGWAMEEQETKYTQTSKNLTDSDYRHIREICEDIYENGVTNLNLVVTESTVFMYVSVRPEDIVYLRAIHSRLNPEGGTLWENTRGIITSIALEELLIMCRYKATGFIMNKLYEKRANEIQKYLKEIYGHIEDGYSNRAPLSKFE